MAKKPKETSFADAFAAGFAMYGGSGRKKPKKKAKTKKKVAKKPSPRKQLAKRAKRIVRPKVKAGMKRMR